METEQRQHVTDGDLQEALAICMVNYRTSFPDHEAVAATLAFWRRFCDLETRWLDGETFVQGVVEMARKHKSNGFLPEWSVFRDYCSQVHTRKEQRRRTAALRERAALVPSDLSAQLATRKRVNGN